MKILKNKTYRRILNQRNFLYARMKRAEDLHETGKGIISFMLDEVLPKEVEKTRQEMIKNWEETKKFEFEQAMNILYSANK